MIGTVEALLGVRFQNSCCMEGSVTSKLVADWMPWELQETGARALDDSP